MGSGQRQSKTKYVVPRVAGGVSIVCPGVFGPMRAVVRSSVDTDTEYRVTLSSGGSIVIGDPESVAVVVEAPESLEVALTAGCGYVAKFGQAAAEGGIVSIEIRLE